MKILAILQNAYSDPRRAVLLREMLSFVINPENLTGKKLYRITAGHELRVANACPEVFHTVAETGKTDLERLKKSIKEYDYDLYISCGKQSNHACIAIIDAFKGKPLIIMPHPASRNLTNALLDAVKKSIVLVKPNQVYEFMQEKGRHRLVISNKTFEKYDV
jgi:ADP-heptose:LPS heptosyltransferase